MEKILELVLNERIVERVILWQAIVLPILGLVGGLIWGRLKKAIRPYTIRGLAIGIMGPIILLLWKVYNRITAIYGLDTVKNLFINLALFVVVGVILGIGYTLVIRYTATAD